MKQFLPLLFYFATTTACPAQDSTIALSKFENFNSQPGRILRTEKRKIGEVGPWGVFVVRSRDVATSAAAAAVLLDDYMLDVPPLVAPKTLYMDPDNLDSVIRVLSFYMKEAEGVKPSYSVQFSYITEADIELSCNYTSFSERWQFSIGKVYHRLRTPIWNTYISFNKKRLIELIELLKQAQAFQW